MTIVLYIAIAILIILGIVLCIGSDETEGLLLGALIAALSLLILIGFISTRELSDDVRVLQQHTDHDKTRIIKENGKTKELYVTIDGKEYHFVFE